jgi:hypothetical protein
LLHKPKTLCSKLSGACQVYSCFKLARDVTDFEAYYIFFVVRLVLTIVIISLPPKSFS